MRLALHLCCIAAFAVGCARGCSELGCDSTLTVEIPATVFADSTPGEEWTVVATGEAFPSSCSFDYTDLPGGNCPLEESLGTVFVDLYWDGVDEPLVEVVVERDGTEVLREELEVDWGEPFRPNGGNCDPECWSGAMSVSDPT
ncbi:MAG: hypothetical protein KDA24_28185 [Deltaproteobacteria bacterium]|nr:hypothetical protein [Deltaproteobacteria bacterium]